MKVLMVILVMLGMIGIVASIIATMIGIIALFISRAAGKRFAIVGFMALIVSSLVFGVGYYDVYINMQNLPTGTFIEQTQSPNGVYTRFVIPKQLPQLGTVKGEPT